MLGANGAGKTTTIKMLCGLLAPTSGEMELAGEHGSLRSSFVRQRIGYMSQKFSLYDDLTINENLDFFAGVYQVPPEEREEKKRWVLEFSGLDGRGEMITGALPGGWKQRVAFGAAIMHEPSVLFLDEPTSGVDPLARRAFWKMINSLPIAASRCWSRRITSKRPSNATGWALWSRASWSRKARRVGSKPRSAAI